jgi:hypothetical protein
VAADGDGGRHAKVPSLVGEILDRIARVLCVLKSDDPEDVAGQEAERMEKDVVGKKMQRLVQEEAVSRLL